MPRGAGGRSTIPAQFARLAEHIGHKCARTVFFCLAQLEDAPIISGRTLEVKIS
jgi:hypothetical protein